MAGTKITILLNEPIGTVSSNLYGQFVEHLGGCVDGGIWVGEESGIANRAGIRTDVVEAIRRIRPGVIRWPGGCFADDYDWEDGVGPRDQRPRRVNGWWGGTIEDNQFGTHEFVRFCRMVGAQPYLAGNLGSLPPMKMKRWVEYCNFSGDSTLSRQRASNGDAEPFGVRYWGVGNESWGCGGNMDPEDYAAEYKRYSTFLQTFMRAPMAMPLYLVACGPNGNDHDWTRRFFAKAGMPRGDYRLHGFAAHYYCGTAGTATEFSTDQWYELLGRAAKVEKLICEQRAILDEVDPQRTVGLIVDEWGTWHPPAEGKNPNHLWQQNTMRDALVAAITLDLFHKHADKVVMANIAQMANVLQAMVLTEGEKMVLTPTYHVFEMYAAHHGGMSIRTEVEAGEVRFVVGEERRAMGGISASASVKDGELTVSVSNLHATLPVEVEIEVRGAGLKGSFTAKVLGHEEISAHNTFDEPDMVRPTERRGEMQGPWRETLPAASVTVLRSSL